MEIFAPTQRLDKPMKKYLPFGSPDRYYASHELEQCSSPKYGFFDLETSLENSLLHRYPNLKQTVERSC